MSKNDRVHLAVFPLYLTRSDQSRTKAHLHIYKGVAAEQLIRFFYISTCSANYETLLTFYFVNFWATEVKL